MATSRDDIRRWLEEGKKQNATHMIVVCDTFEYDDYPVYVLPGQDVRKEHAKYDGKNMQRVMEVYHYGMDLEQQVVQGRVFNFDLPEKPVHPGYGPTPPDAGERGGGYDTLEQQAEFTVELPKGKVVKLPSVRAVPQPDPFELMVDLQQFLEKEGVEVRTRYDNKKWWCTLYYGGHPLVVGLGDSLTKAIVGAVTDYETFKANKKG